MLLKRIIFLSQIKTDGSILMNLMIWLKHVNATQRTMSHQAPLSMEFIGKEYWSGLTLPSPGHLPYWMIKPTSLVSPSLAGRFFTSWATWNPFVLFVYGEVIFFILYVHMTNCRNSPTPKQKRDRITSSPCAF